MYLLIKCSFKKNKTSRVGSEVAEVLRGLGSSAFFDYVRTELNPGDYTTRKELLQGLIRMFNPKWLEASVDMMEADTWEKRFAGALKRERDPLLEDVLGGKRMKVNTCIDPPRQGFILL